MFDDDIVGSLCQWHCLPGADVCVLVQEKTEQHQKGGRRAKRRIHE
jgi:hypothetical protein